MWKRLMISTKRQKVTKVSVAEQLDQIEPKKIAEPAEKLLSFSLRDDPIKYIQIRSLLLEKEKNQLLDFLNQNENIFIWSASDMPGISPEIIVHGLNVDSKFKPV